MLALSSVSHDDLSAMCNLDIMDRAAQQTRIRAAGGFRKQLMSEKDLSAFQKQILLSAHHFDRISQRLIDDNMCTEHCKCYSIVSLKMDGTRNITVRRDGKFAYQNLKEEYLNRFNRSWISSVGGKKPFVWSTDATDSFTSFEDCLDHWFAKKRKDNSNNLSEVFGLSPIELQGINSYLLEGGIKDRRQIRN